MRHYWNKKLTVEDCHGLDTAKLREWGYLRNSFYSGGVRWTRNGEKIASIGVSVDGDNAALQVRYTNTNRETEEKTNFDYKILLEKTPCNYGGVRFWFLCPHCGRRMRKLHLYGVRKFLCRVCLNLSYASRNAGGFFKMVGVTMSGSELDELMIKSRPSYNGKMTRSWKRFLKCRDKADRADSAMIAEFLGRG